MMHYEENEEDFGELIEELFESIKKKAKELEKMKAEITPRKEAQVNRKLKLQEENDRLQRRMEKVTDNTYVEIGEFLNEYLEEDNERLRKLYDKCEKWLIDNNKPFKNEI